MFRIRRVYDVSTPENKMAVKRAQEILKSQFPKLAPDEIIELPRKLSNPVKYRFRSILFVAEDVKHQIKGFALLFHDPNLNFCYLDFLSSEKKMTGRGIGGAIYERVRKEALSLNSIGIFFECLPDDPKLSRNPEIRKQNISRLRFYERYGAYPIINTAYETPVKPEGDNPPYLVFDDLGRGTNLERDTTRLIVKAILERKYAKVVNQAYIDMVVESFKDNPVKLRQPKYVKKSVPIPIRETTPDDKIITLVFNDRHFIHHVQEIGYVEAPASIESILKELETVDLFKRVSPSHFGEKYIRAVHDAGYAAYLKKACSGMEPGVSIYPYVFPIRRRTRPPKSLPTRAGYYCIDTFTPVNKNAYLAARAAVDCVLTAARELKYNCRLAYALVRPPGHHAGKAYFGGFCYLNSAAAAAQFFCSEGKVAILDIDYHHGDGQQDIFYDRQDILTVSIHCQPSSAYPYFSGYKTETGEGSGAGYNHNFPLPEKVDGTKFYKTLKQALNKIKKFKPEYLIVDLGLDTAAGDPTGSWNLEADDFYRNGKLIGTLNIPTLIVQEGGYDTKTLGINARSFFEGLWNGMYSI
jgi:acetoin utilization deacetylase AcuC-like enzyme/GNAT superfamily N-acetyltransferase